MKLRDWMQSGAPQIWFTAGSVTISIWSSAYCG